MNPDRSKTKIAIVDDDPDLREVLGITLEGEGYEVFYAEDGLDALKTIKENQVNLVISDYRMPNCDGRQLLLLLREIRNAPPVIMVSGELDISSSDFFKLGAKAFIPKPYTFSDLKPVIDRILASYQRLHK